MDVVDLDLEIKKLGESRIASPMSGIAFVEDHQKVLYYSDPSDVIPYFRDGKDPPCFETAGPREKVYFDPSKLKCGIVTCGGLCPGINDVIRAIVLSLFYHYGIQTVFGFRYGFEGLSPKYSHIPIELNPEKVDGIHQEGGTILGSSRGSQDISEMVDTLERMNIGILFAIGGD
jgi:6-phosphofructokinase 1